VLQTNAIQPSLVDANLLTFQAGQHNVKNCEQSSRQALLAKVTAKLHVCHAASIRVSHLFTVMISKFAG
jgi:hypothetical protein